MHSGRHRNTLVRDRAYAAACRMLGRVAVSNQVLAKAPSRGLYATESGTLSNSRPIPTVSPRWQAFRRHLSDLPLVWYEGLKIA